MQRTRPPSSFALIIAIALAACAAGKEAPPAAAAGEPTSKSAAGNFLAGFSAQRGNDAGAAADFFDAALAVETGDMQILLRALAANLQDGRGDRAAALAERILALDPGSSLAQLTLALRDARSGRHAEAEQRFSQLRRAGPNAVLGPMLTAWSRAGQAKTDPAKIDGALEVLKVEKTGSQVDIAGMFHLHAGLIAELGGRNDLAETSYRAALRGEAPALRVVLAAGRFFERIGKPAEAETLYAAFTARAGDPIYMAGDLARLRAGQAPPPPLSEAASGMAEALFDTAAALQSDRTSDLALIYVQMALWLNPDFPAARLLVGSLYDGDQRYARANEAYAAVSADPVYGWSAKLQRAQNLDQTGQSDEAVTLLEAMAEERPERTDALVRLGDLWRAKVKMQGPFPEYAKAIAAYDRAVARLPQPQPQHWSLFFARGVAHERSGDWPKAELDMLKALELEPEQPSVLNYLGYSWADQRIHLDRALPMIRRAVELRPRDGYIVDSLGWVNFRLGHLDDALRYMEQAVELRPQDATINDHLGDVYWRVGRHAEARFQWERALRLEPEPDQVPLIRAKLDHGLPPATP